jgi:hypothetical protein
MSKAASYLDWELSLKYNKPDNGKIIRSNNPNSIGMSETNFKDFMKKWKEKNLS